MTLLTPETDAHPRTHALVIGVGGYPHLAGRNPSFPGLGHLESPPRSALAFARWFLNEYQNPEAPRGTLDIYASSEDGPVDFLDGAGQSTRIDPADKAHIGPGVSRWADQVDKEEGDIALFYFCGHGVSAGIHDGLLLQNFAASRRAILANAIDIDGLHLAMDGSRARRQCYFIDACRNTPSGIAELVVDGGIGDPILSGRVQQGRFGPRDAPLFFSTLASQKAYGRAGDVSLFTAALLETLRRGAAVKDSGRWAIRTDRILHSLNAHLFRLARREQLPMQPAVQSDGSGFVLQPLPSAPSVPVTVSCVPTTATEVADLAYTNREGVSKTRPARARADWDIECEVSSYEFRAEFSDGSFQNQKSWEVVSPPALDVPLDVKK